MIVSPIAFKGKENRQIFGDFPVVKNVNHKLPQILESISKEDLSQAGKKSQRLLPKQSRLNPVLSRKSLLVKPKISPNKEASIASNKEIYINELSLDAQIELSPPYIVSGDIATRENHSIKSSPRRRFSAPLKLNKEHSSSIKTEGDEESLQQSNFEKSSYEKTISKSTLKSSTSLDELDHTFSPRRHRGTQSANQLEAKKKSERNSLNFPDGLKKESLDLSGWDVDSNSQKKRIKSPNYSKSEEYQKIQSGANHSENHPQNENINFNENQQLSTDNRKIDLINPKPVESNEESNTLYSNEENMLFELDNDSSALIKDLVSDSPSTIPIVKEPRVTISSMSRRSIASVKSLRSVKSYKSSPKNFMSSDPEHPSFQDLESISSKYPSRSETRQSILQESEADRQDYYKYYENLVRNEYDTTERDLTSSNFFTESMTFIQTKESNDNESVIQSLPYKKVAMENFKRSVKRLEEHYYDDVGFYVRKMDSKLVDDTVHRGDKLQVPVELESAREPALNTNRKRHSLPIKFQAPRAIQDRPPSSLHHRRLSLNSTNLKSLNTSRSKNSNFNLDIKKKKNIDSLHHIRIHMNTPKLPPSTESPNEYNLSSDTIQFSAYSPVAPMITGIEKSPRYIMPGTLSILDQSSPQNSLPKNTFVSFSQERPPMPLYNRILHKPVVQYNKRRSINPFSTTIPTSRDAQQEKTLSLKEKMIIMERGHKFSPSI